MAFLEVSLHFDKPYKWPTWAKWTKNGLHSNENHSENLDYLSDYICRGLYKRGTTKIVLYLWLNFQLSFTSQGRNHLGINSLQMNPCPIVGLLKCVTKRWTIFIPDLKWSIWHVLLILKCQCAFTTAWRFRDNVSSTILRHSFYCGFHCFSMEVSRSIVFVCAPVIACRPCAHIRFTSSDDLSQRLA